MKESLDVVKIATLNYLTDHKHLTQEEIEKYSYHLHVPMGAVPKDGPSAGISIFSALTSILMDKPIRSNLAMTGEISTLGEVIAIGGVREKLTACKNHGIQTVILPWSNKKNFDILPIEFKSGFTVYFVKNISEVFEIAFNKDESDILKLEFEDDDYCKKLIESEFIN